MEGNTEKKDKKVWIVFYSMYGHVESLARKIKEGIDSIDGVTAEIFRTEETISDDVLQKMHAPPKSEDIPVWTREKFDEMTKVDGFMFGTPTRFGMMSTQLKNWFDGTGKLWMTGGLVGKPAGLFFSTGSQGGGQETTALTAVTQLVHHGMIYVPLGYAFGPKYFTMNEVKAGSPYGAGTYAGDGSRLATDLELEIAKFQGEQFGKFITRLN
jgi:NAD(P)H dehydrogenase (quinone)